jgi:hypothetical protein
MAESACDAKERTVKHALHFTVVLVSLPFLRAWLSTASPASPMQIYKTSACLKQLVFRRIRQGLKDSPRYPDSIFSPSHGPSPCRILYEGEADHTLVTKTVQSALP